MTSSVRLSLGRYGLLRRVLPDSAAETSARSVPPEVGRKWLGVQGLQTCYHSLPCPTAGGARMGATGHPAKPEAGPSVTADA
jgi:hypothetical protein